MKDIGFISILVLSSFLVAGVDPLSTDGLSEIERDARALEIYLQDRKDYEEYCSQLEWEQPSIEVYKETLISQLPEECKQ